jgi:predicted transcriptional regulator
MMIRRAPQLKWTIRKSFGSRLDPLVKEGLRAIAKQENKSMSWVVEETIIRYFKLKHCVYKDKK